MKSENKILYEIFINDSQFTCIFENIQNEKNISKILGISDLEFIEKKENLDITQMYYKLNNLEKIKIFLDEKLILEKDYPLAINLKRLRELLLVKLDDNFCFTINGSIIQRQEEYMFLLKNVIKNNTLNLTIIDFNFNNKEDIQKAKNNDFKNDDNLNKNNESPEILKTSSSGKTYSNEQEEKIKDNNDINDKDNNKINDDENKIINEKSNKLVNEKNDDLNSENKTYNDEKNNKIYNENEKSNKNNKDEQTKISKDLEENIIENEYEIINNDIHVCKIKISPEMTLEDLREKIHKLIPRRALFLKNEEKIEPSKEDTIAIKAIADQKLIYIEAPKEIKGDTMEIEIFLNGKTYIKKDFYITIKLKSFRNNLKLDHSYKIIFKGKPLTIEEENNMTLDELCYKELKVSFFKLKDNDNIPLNNSSINNNTILEKKIYIDLFRHYDKYDIWILLGKEKSGKTTFINCLLNYCLGVKYEDKFRYIVKENNINGYGTYDIKGSSTKIRIIEFPGFSGIPEEDKSNVETIKKFLKIVNKVKIIGFIISGSQTRLTDEVKIIFSTVLNLFGYDIINNFIFLITNCDVKDPPVIDCIRSSNFSKILSKLKNPWLFKFNNSYLFEMLKNDFWSLGISNYDTLMNGLIERNNISLEITKKFIDLNNLYKDNKDNFITSLYKLQNIKVYINMLNNINNINYTGLNQLIPFEYTEKCKICSNCKNIIKNNSNFCEYNCQNYQIIYKDKKFKQISIRKLKFNQLYLKNCYNIYSNNFMNIFINTAILYQQIRDCYDYQLIKNNTLLDEFKSTIYENKSEESKILFSEINGQENLYKAFKNQNCKNNYKDFVFSLGFEQLFKYYA